MRIRRRYQSPLPPPDLSSHIPPSMAAAAAAAAAAEVAAPTVAAAGGATGGKGGEATAAAGSRASGSRYGGGGGRGLHSNGRPTNPTPCPPFDAPPSGAAAERGDLPGGGAPLATTRDVLVYHGHGRQAPKQEPDGEIDGGDAHGCGGTGTAPAPKSCLGAKASQVPVGHGGHRVPPRGATAALAAAQVMVRWSDGEGRLPPNKRGRYLAALGRSWGLDEEEKEEENMVAEREMEQRRPSNSRRRRTAASSTPTVAAPAGTALTSAGSTGNIGGAPTATGDGAGDDVVVKEEGGGDVVPATAASTLGDGNRGSGNGKKIRRSPAVLMEGSRCSRVNGRGWRCCQQTLVGYSLCEHHLGKGRLRSVSSVRCNGRARKKEEVDTAALPPAPSPLQQQDQPLSGVDGEDEEEEKPSKRKRNKIGMVKARSISSLLHQPAHSTPATIAAPEPFTSPSPTPPTCPVTAAAPPPYGID